jgi:hypothetical protein
MSREGEQTKDLIINGLKNPTFLSYRLKKTFEIRPNHLIHYQ